MLSEYIPAILENDVDTFFTEDDLMLVELLLQGKITDEQMLQAGISKERLPELIESAYRKELLNKRERVDGTIEYELRPANDVVNNATVFRQNAFQALSREDRVRIEEWLYNDFLLRKKSMKVEELADNGNEVLPLAAAIDYLTEHGDSFFVIPCDCVCKFEGELNRSKEVCICLERGLNSHEDRGLGKQISLDEAIELLRETERQGLVHSAEMENICNCDVRYCYPTRASIDMGVVNTWPATKYIVTMDEAQCVGCGICEARCQFGVLERRASGKISVDYSKCWGCGVCTSTCPTGALSVIERSRL